ncbi:MAG: phosphatidylserine/phosphatidylglycerophosphate/cardiolipin synthase family protein [Spirochaetia bacterium]|nr:phosphatidylserine/phosphatidylglycerophosphate/cardiolipin synthase family protein [Spirochaetia bacterium]
MILFCICFFSYFSCRNDQDSPFYWFDDPYFLEYGFFFTHPSDAVNHERKFIALDTANRAILLANSSIEIWCYGMTEPSIIKNLQEKKRQGISVKIIGSYGTDYSHLEKAGFQVEQRALTGLQHAKVILIDRTILISGTGNFTGSGFLYNNNLFFFLRIPHDTAEKISDSLNHEQIPSERIRLPYSGEMIISPGRGKWIQSRILHGILNAKYRIRYLIFSHTDPVITDALYAAAQRGILVEGIYDSSGYSESLPKNSEAERLRMNAPLNFFIYIEGNRSRLENQPGEFHGGHLHHKTLIVDDHSVYTGSYNWSMSARNKNLEAFYEFHDPLTVSLFSDEFNRLKNEAMYIQPSLLAQSSPPLLIQYSNTDRMFCITGDAMLSPFTVFSGRGPFFRAERYAGPFDSSCIFQDQRQASSAGPLSGSGYLIKPDSNNGLIYNFAYNLDVSSSRFHASMPCDDGSCRILRSFRASIPSGWIWTEENLMFTEIIIWDKNGFSAELPFISSTPGFHKFQGGTGDAVLFLKKSSGVTLLACVQNGTTLDPSLQYFIETMEWYMETDIPCIPDEG